VSDNVEVVKRAFAAFDRGDSDEFLSLLADDVDWRVSAYLTGEGDKQGKEAVRQWLRHVSSLAAYGERVQIVPDSYRELDDRRVLVLGSGRIEREEDTLEEEVGWIWEIEDGKVVRMTDFLSHAEAIEAAGRG
jgi:ketosteroid isomerase-like protein